MLRQKSLRVELTVRNISQGGVGLTTARTLHVRTVVLFEMDAPPLDGCAAATRLTGRIKTAHTVACGTEILGAGIWHVPPAGLDVVTRWIERLRR